MLGEGGVGQFEWGIDWHSMYRFSRTTSTWEVFVVGVWLVFTGMGPYFGAFAQARDARNKLRSESHPRRRDFKFNFFPTAVPVTPVQ